MGVSRPSIFFLNDTATTEIYTLSLHDALPICIQDAAVAAGAATQIGPDIDVRGGLCGARGLHVLDDEGEAWLDTRLRSDRCLASSNHSRTDGVGSMLNDCDGEG